MSLSATTAKNQSAGNGTGPYTYAFYIVALTELQVVVSDASGNETTLVKDAASNGYTVTDALDPDNPGGSIVTTESYTSGYTITITRLPALTQEDDYRTSGLIPPETLEKSFDKQMMTAQYLKEIIDRCLRVPVSSSLTEIEVPVAADKVIGWNANGDGLTTFDATTLQTLDMVYVSDYATLAAAIAANPSKTILIDQTTTIAADTIVPSTTELWMLDVAKFSVSAGKTLTINGPLRAGLKQIFSGSGTVKFNQQMPEVYPEWWGAAGDFVTDDTAAIAAAIASVNTGSASTTGGRIKFTNRYLTDPITLGVSDVRLVIEGRSNTSTQIKLNDNSDATLLTINGGRVVISDILFDGNRANQTAGNVITVSSGVPHVTLYNVSAYNGYQYGLSDFGTTTRAFSSIFSSNNIGVKVGNNTTHFYGCTFEDNLSGGAICEGSGTVIMASFNGCWFEDNALGLTNPTYHIKATGIGALNAITVDNCYFSGGTQAALMGAISIAGSAINNWKFTNNQIFNCNQGIFSLPNNMWNYYNEFTNNKPTGTTPAIADSDRKPGFFFDESQRFHYISPVIDLSGAAVTYPIITATGTRYVTLKKVTAVYTEASSADAGINLAVEYNGTGTDLITYTSETGQAQWSANDVTIGTSSATLDGDKTLTLRSPGGKTGTGEVSLQVVGILW